MGREKEAFLVDTPLQLFNALSFVCTGQKRNCDLYIVKQFTDADNIIERLSGCNIFSEIYTIEKPGKHSFGALHNTLALLFPGLYCRREYKLSLKKEYKTIYLAFNTLMFEFIIAACSPDRVTGFEDGIGSYFGDIFHDYLGIKYLFFRWLTGHSYRVEELYLRSPRYYTGTDIRLCTLKSPDKESSDMIKYIFGYEEDRLYTVNKTVYLNQPMEDFAPGHREAEKKTVEAVSGALGSEYIVRLHPRETEREIYSSGIIDEQNNMWEILCGGVISDEHILIGIFSTAQFFPKYCFDKEPYVIFTYPLYDDLTEQETARFGEMAQKLRDIYRDREKVMTAGSFDELSRMLSEIKMGADNC